MKVNGFKLVIMRKITIVFFILLAFSASNCGSGTGSTTANSASKGMSGSSEISFREYQHDFGKVSEGEKLSYTFIFDNKGTGDLVITSASTTCGCTVPKYDKKPIPPGSNGNLEVVFDTSGRDGMQTKTITVKSNAKIPVVLLKITAQVTASDK
jgi:hypothetical protein